MRNCLVLLVSLPENSNKSDRLASQLVGRNSWHLQPSHDEPIRKLVHWNVPTNQTFSLKNILHSMINTTTTYSLTEHSENDIITRSDLKYSSPAFNEHACCKKVNGTKPFVFRILCWKLDWSLIRKIVTTLFSECSILGAFVKNLCTALTIMQIPALSTLWPPVRPY